MSNIGSNNDMYTGLSQLKGESILVVTKSDQLNIFGETFRPIFCGKVTEITRGFLTLSPITIKMVNAPFFVFPTPLSIPLENIAHFTPDFDCKTRFPIV